MLLSKPRQLTFDDVSLVPQYSEITSRSLCSLESRLDTDTVSALPLISSPMSTVTGTAMVYALGRYGALACLPRFSSPQEQLMSFNACRKENPLSSLKPIPSFGVTGDWWPRIQRFLAESDLGDGDYICLDVAHGDNALVRSALEIITSKTELRVIAGNIATPEAALRLITWGADALRVGIGGGSCCTTRQVSGHGIPMVSCLLDICEAVQEYDTPVIADGGMKTSGDMAKALACGASYVMLGSVLAGCRESPGDVITEGTWPNQRKFKRFQGSASAEDKNQRGETRHVEGVSTVIEYKGKVGRIIEDISDGLKSAFSYSGARSIEEFHRKAELVEISQAGVLEAKPHILYR